MLWHNPTNKTLTSTFPAHPPVLFDIRSGQTQGWYKILNFFEGKSRPGLAVIELHTPMMLAHEPNHNPTDPELAGIWLHTPVALAHEPNLNPSDPDAMGGC
jgi:hypothetical protein